ncbi:hypothetical protein [Bradyrhizobium yuanmingense]|uniref:hypothetical protein n=1 Tax=Bradyrhizobium yuanmingense TaxID=108015 RepID=UPI0023B89A28|nr:hypothetical protein [Bradyrhizobium yuanmingense]MDF0578887.1 hypothetical protein [Bradyrhizobium yuanmingense]
MKNKQDVTHSPNAALYEDRQKRIVRLSVHLLLFSTLILAKFGISSGDGSYIPIALPALLISVAVLFEYKYLVIDRNSTLLFLMVVLFACISFLYNIAIFDARSTSSTASFLLFLILNFTLVFRPAHKKYTDMLVNISSKYFIFLAMCGILQYFLQFAGYPIPNFGSLFPFLKPVLLEEFFNSNAIVEYGSDTLRSNGLFLLEPSTFSQLMVTAGCIDFLVRRRYAFLPLYALGYLVSYSGTGFLSFAVAAFLASVISPRQAMRIPLYLLACFIAYFSAALAAPDILARYIARLGEFSSPGSSAYFRYVAQHIAWNDLMQDGRILTGWGPGGFRQYSAFGIASNALLKLTSDYGLITALCQFCLLAYALWHRRYALIPLYFLARYQLGGGAELNPAFFVLAAVCCIWGLESKKLSAQIKPMSARSKSLRDATNCSRPSSPSPMDA